MSDAKKLSHDAVTKVLFEQITKGIAEIEKANETLLAAEDAGAGLRDIDKALKEAKHENEKVSEAWQAAEAARTTYKAALEAARNLYRVEVLKEEAKESSDVDTSELKESVKETRGLVMQSVSLIKSYAQANGKADIVAWADSLSIPQVGRKGESVVGQKKPRAQVKVGDTLTESFGEAAKAASIVLSKNGEKVTYASGDLVAAWEANGSKPEFTFHGLPVVVIPKTKEEAKK